MDALRAAVDFDDDLDGWITAADLRRWLDIFDSNGNNSFMYIDAVMFTQYFVSLMRKFGGWVLMIFFGLGGQYFFIEFQMAEISDDFSFVLNQSSID